MIGWKDPSEFRHLSLIGKLLFPSTFGFANKLCYYMLTYTSIVCTSNDNVLVVALIKIRNACARETFIHFQSFSICLIIHLKQLYTIFLHATYTLPTFLPHLNYYYKIVPSYLFFEKHIHASYRPTYSR